MQKTYDIYISYARTVFDFSKRLATLLEKQGFSIFADFNNLSSGLFEEKIFEAIIGSKCLILIYSKDVESSQFIRREIEFAEDSGIRIIPILLTDFIEHSWYKKNLIKYSPIRCYEIDSLHEISGCLLQLINRIIERQEHRTCSLAYPSDFSLSCISSYTCKEKAQREISSNQSFQTEALSSNRWKRGCVISIVLLIILGVGIFVSTRFASLSPPHPVSSSPPCTAPSSPPCTAPSSPPHPVSSSPPCTAPSSPPHPVSSSPPCTAPSSSPHDAISSPPHKVSDFYIVCLTLLVIIAACGFAVFKYRKSKRKNVKITCNKSAIIHIDGNPVAELEAHKVHTIHLSKGKFVVDFQLISDKSKHKSMPINISRVSEDVIVEGKFQSLLYDRNIIKVFIAGSTRLVAERDALRSVIGQMYNKYKEDNFLVEAYSFDDFPREFIEGGHQKLYDEFIRQEANWVVFITDGDMGEKTIWELENAISAYKSEKRPKILMYSKPEKTQSSQQMDSFRRLLLAENQYWIDYNSLNDIKTSFRDHLQWDLYNLMKSQYKKTI